MFLRVHSGVSISFVGAVLYIACSGVAHAGPVTFVNYAVNRCATVSSRFSIRFRVCILFIAAILVFQPATQADIVNDHTSGSAQLLEISPVGQTFTAVDPTIYAISMGVSDFNSNFYPEDDDLLLIVRAGATLTFIANVATMLLNYARDARRPYTVPTSCSGATYYAGSCTAANMACKDNIDDLAVEINNLTNVSTAFKKCMKGRLGCGGSYHPQVKVRCDFAAFPNCGPCTVPPGYYAGGCNLAGRDVWYCEDTTDNCVCARAFFHEVSHTCGALDQAPHTAPLSSYRIGDWFRDQCEN